MEKTGFLAMVKLKRVDGSIELICEIQTARLFKFLYRLEDNFEEAGVRRRLLKYQSRKTDEMRLMSYKT